VFSGACALAPRWAKAIGGRSKEGSTSLKADSLRADVTSVTNPSAETIVKATCPDCGDVELALADLLLRVCMDDGTGAYSFTCPDCDLRVSKLAEPVVVEVLLASDVAFEAWCLPAELHERPGGPRISHDDVLEFHMQLQDPDWFARLAATVNL
jgi:predicted RNA-binding Zn-ribbon protein involved in translation (DUF1610 family)